jgi:polyisoprenoid-binding protein YceI
MNNYPLVKSKVDDARRNGENIVNMTGDLLLPGAEKTETCEFPETQREQKFIVTGCIVYRFADGTIHHTELSYWIDLNEGEKARFRTLWFQAAD